MFTENIGHGQGRAAAVSDILIEDRHNRVNTLKNEIGLMALLYAFSLLWANSAPSIERMFPRTISIWKKSIYFPGEDALREFFHILPSSGRIYGNQPSLPPVPGSYLENFHKNTSTFGVLPALILGYNDPV
jgi:hypothetical protein